MDLSEDEINWYWSQFPELEREDVVAILEMCSESSDEYHMYKTFNNEAS